MNIIEEIGYRWHSGWVPREKVLTHHLTHILGGLVAFFALIVLFKFDPLGAALIVSGLALLAEVIGLIAGETVVSSLHDMVQYTFCWPFYILIDSGLLWFAASLLVWAAGYFTILITKPSEE